MNGPPYPKPPIQEALVEFRFANDESWNWTVPGRLWELLKGSYDGAPRSEQVITVNAQQKAKRVATQAAGGVGRLFLTRKDGSGLVAVAPSTVSIHVLAPYLGWGHFLPRVREVVEAYPSVHDGPSVISIGVRYINRVVIPAESLELKEWFTASPTLPPGVNRPMSALMSRVETHYEDGARLAITLGTLSPSDEDDGLPFLVDVDLQQANMEPTALADTLSTVELLHERETEAFEAMITNKTRALFR